jgi:methionine--tRNA ligase beta chain
MKYLGIDYGTKRIGLAVSDEDGKIAFPRDVVKVSAGLADDIKELCTAEGIKTVIIGESKDFSGNDNPIAPDINKLKEELENRELTVHLEPEFMTSSQASRIQGNVEKLDASAASIILQSFLDKQKKDTEPPAEKISYQEFTKVEIKVGKILQAEKIEKADKLLKLIVDFGEKEPRQIVSGIAMYFPKPEELIGKNCLFVTNLEPRVIRGYESNGMILALSAVDGAFSLLMPDRSIQIGTKVR